MPSSQLVAFVRIHKITFEHVDSCGLAAKMGSRGCSFFRPRNVFFQTAQLVHLVFDRGMSFFRPLSFFRPRDEA